MGNAVKRNRLRRRFRAALGEVLRDFPTEREPLDVVLIPRQASLEVPFEKLKGILKELMHQLPGSSPEQRAC